MRFVGVGLGPALNPRPLERSISKLRTPNRDLKTEDLNPPHERAPTMQQTEHFFRGERGFRIVYQATQPPSSARAVVVLVHGNSEHMGRYAHVVSALAARGFAVYNHDHRGHGKSEGVRGDVEDFRFFVRDLDQLVEIARGQHPGLPAFLIGHSLGGLIAFTYALEHERKLAGLVLMSPALEFGADVSPLLKQLSGVVARALPLLPITPSHKQPESVLSRDPEVQRLFDADPLCYSGDVRARYGSQLLQAAKYARARGRNLRLPVLIQYGTADKLVSPEGAKALYKRLRSSDKRMVEWEGARHELFNELEKSRVILGVLEWLEERLERREVPLPG